MSKELLELYDNFEDLLDDFDLEMSIHIANNIDSAAEARRKILKNLTKKSDEEIEKHLVEYRNYYLKYKDLECPSNKKLREAKNDRS